jgi:hypothetical protein
LPIAHTLAKDILGGTIDPVRGWLNLPWRNDQPLGPIGAFFEFASPDGMVSFDDEFHKHLCLLVKDFFSRKANA